MIFRKLYNTLFLFLSLSLVACGNNHNVISEEVSPEEVILEEVSPEEVIPEEVTLEEVTPEEVIPEEMLSFFTPIADIMLAGDEVLNFSIPTDTCVDSNDAVVSYEVEFTNNVGFIFNGSQLSGLPIGIGIVNVIITCSTTTESLTDEFTITVEDFEAEPIVDIDAPNLAKAGNNITLTAIAKDVNFTGQVVSYEWQQMSGPSIDLTNRSTAVTNFITPDTTEQSSVVFSVTVTDNDGSTATDSVEIDLISTLAPSISLSFPLTLGVYNEDKIDMFGNVEAVASDIINVGGSIINIDLIVDSVSYPAVITDNTWRVENVIFTDVTDIKALVTSSDGFINYQEIILVNDELYPTSINHNISDIAVNESTDDIYVQVNGDSASDTQFIKFNLTSAENSILTINQPDDYNYSTYTPTSIALDAASDTLFVSYSSAISKIDLTTNDETLLSDSNRGFGTFPQLVLDLSYNSTSNTLYSTDINAQSINIVNINSGNRTDIIVNLDSGSAIAANSTTGDIYYSQGVNTTAQTLIKENDITTNSSSTIYNISAGDEGGPISDIAINEVGEELFFVDGSGSLIKLDLADNSTTEVIPNLFVVENIINAQTPLIGLDYHAERNVLIVAGKGSDGTNKLLVIDPKSGDYAKVATGE